MKKFVFLFIGSVTATEEIKKDWGDWFAAISDHIIDSGNPFGAGREITRNGTKDLPYGPDSIAGYTIIKAKNLAEAEKIAQGCPMISAVRVYEAVPM